MLSALLVGPTSRRNDERSLPRSDAPRRQRRTRAWRSFRSASGKYSNLPQHIKEIAMAIAADRKVAIVKEYALHPGDTGSPEVQVALLTEHIVALTEHLKVHRKDYTTRRGLLMMVGNRNKLLKFLRQREPERYKQLVDRLGLRRR